MDYDNVGRNELIGRVQVSGKALLLEWHYTSLKMINEMGVEFHENKSQTLRDRCGGFMCSVNAEGRLDRIRGTIR